MGGKSIAARAANEKARYRIAHQSMKKLMEERAASEKAPPTREEITCPHCGFKARYPFLRCPQCGEIHKEPKKKEERK